MQSEPKRFNLDFMISRLGDKFLLETTVFVSGALVMIYEIVGSRILAPYIGT